MFDSLKKPLNTRPKWQFLGTSGALPGAKTNRTTHKKYIRKRSTHRTNILAIIQIQFIIFAQAYEQKGLHLTIHRTIGLTDY